MASTEPSSPHTSTMQDEQIQMLSEFVALCKSNHRIYYLPELSFWKEYLESIGANIPPRPPPTVDEMYVPQYTNQQKQPEAPQQKQEEPQQQPEAEAKVEEEEEEDIESDLDIPSEGVIVDEDEDMPEYGDPNIEVTDEMIDQANDKRSAAMDAASEGRLEEAIDFFTEATKLNPTSALMLAKRASVYLRMKKPKKAIHDCTKAIEVNSDSAQGYKWRGKAYKVLGQWEEAYHDLTMACKLDYDDDANEMLHDVTPNAKKIMEHKRKYERIREEKEQKRRKEKIRERRQEYERMKEEQSANSTSDGGFAGFPGAFPGSGGGMPGMPGLAELLQDPELLAAFQDEEVSKAFQDVAMNPANISKYQNNPKVQKVMNKMAAKFGTGEGQGEGGAGGAGGFPGFS